MITIDITEKLWDGVRPDSVKKTGLSEAIRTFIKANPKGGPNSPKAYDDLSDAVAKLGEAIGKTEDAVKKAKDDKKGAAAKLKTWKGQCDKAVEDLGKERQTLGLMKASKEADGKMKDLAKTVDDAINQAKQLTKDLKEGKIKDNKKVGQGLQDLRSAMRDGLKATQKDGFADYIRTIDEVLAWKVNPSEVPMPPTAASIKSKLPELQKVAEEARVEAEKLMEQTGQNRTGKIADFAKPLVAEYKGLAKDIKNFIPRAQKLGADAHAIADKFKEIIKGGMTYDKLLPRAQGMHDKVMACDDEAVKACARGRVSGGDIQAKRIKMRDSLKSNPAEFAEFETIVGEEWNLIMVIFREASEQIAEAHRQVERVLRLIGQSDPAAKGPADTMLKTFDDDRRNLASKYK